MNKIKLITALLLAALLLTACGGNSTPETTAAPTEAATEAPTAAPTTEAPTEPADDGKTTYTVTIQDENGNPIPGAMVQLCMETCIPGVADANGVATFQVAEADYKVSFLALPAGFTYSGDAQEFYFEAGSTEMTIVLKAA